MSYKALNWLANIPAHAITAGAFRALFHLCDAHNARRSPETACFPSQKSLRASTGLSNSGLNKALNALEAAKLIRRRRTWNPKGIRGSTYYILGCDRDLAREPSPQNGDGGQAENRPGRPVDKSVDKSSTNSSLGPSPTPVQASYHLHLGGD